MPVLAMKWIRKSVSSYRWLCNHLHGLCRSLFDNYYCCLDGTPAEPYTQLFLITDSQKLLWKHGSLFFSFRFHEPKQSPFQ